MKDLEKRVVAIEKRNKKVETDKTGDIMDKKNLHNDINIYSCYSIFLRNKKI